MQLICETDGVRDNETIKQAQKSQILHKLHDIL